MIATRVELISFFSFYRQAFGSPRVTVDLVNPDIQIDATLNARAVDDNKKPFISFPTPHTSGTYGQVQTIGSMLEFNFLGRNNEVNEPSPFCLL